MRFLRVRRDVLALRVIERLLRPGDVALDIGAHRGVYSAGMLRSVGRAGAVEAFEPNPRHAAQLRAMARRARNFTVHEGALSDRDGSAELMVPTVQGTQYHGYGSLRDPRDRLVDAVIEVVDVSTHRLDDLLAGAERVDFVKCDVEGHEEEVLRGAEDILTRFRPTVLIELEQRHRGTDPNLTIDYLMGFGLTGYALFHEGLGPVEHFDLECNQLQYLSSLDPSQPAPAGYVRDFVFVRPGTELGDLVA